jgi:molybdopterin converting factor small subunit
VKTRRIRILAFSAAKQWLPSGELTLEAEPSESLIQIVARTLPDLPSAAMRVALDQCYVSWDSPLGSGSEIAIIPPVSGG